MLHLIPNLLSSNQSRFSLFAAARSIDVEESQRLQLTCIRQLTNYNRGKALDDFTSGFDYKSLVRLRLTDTDLTGSLLGFRY